MEFFQNMYYTNDMTLARPFIKWVGGKSQLLEKIEEKYPSAVPHFAIAHPPRFAAVDCFAGAP